MKKFLFLSQPSSRSINALQKKRPQQNSLWKITVIRLARVQRNKAEGACNKTPKSKIQRNKALNHFERGTEFTDKNFETKIAENKNIKPHWHCVGSSRKSKQTVHSLIKGNMENSTESDDDCAYVLSTVIFFSVFATANQTHALFAVTKTTDAIVSKTFTTAC